MLFIVERRLPSVLAIFAVALFALSSPLGADEVEIVPPRIATAPARIVEGRNITFHRLPASAGLSQTRVSLITQDSDGFLWFGTQSGLNRYDGYKFKVFKHDARLPGSLSGVFLYSLFKDNSGSLWAGSDQYFDKYDPATETFHRVAVSEATGKTVNFANPWQDRTGTMWLPTRDGLYRLNPSNGKTVHYRHDPKDSTSLNQQEVQTVNEDSSGALWVGMSGGFDVFDPQAGKVRKRIAIEDTGYSVWLHEDRFHRTWVRDGNGRLGILDRDQNTLTHFAFEGASGGAKSAVEILCMLEERDGTMWFGTANRGLLRYDRERNVFSSYTSHPGDSEGLPENRIITLFQDREGNIWAGLHQTAPVFFSSRPASFEKFVYRPGDSDSLGSALVSVIHEDREGALWIGADRLIKRVDRKTGKYSTFDPIQGHEVLSIVEQNPGIMWMGTGGMGLKRYDRKTGQVRTFLSSGKPTELCSNFVEKLMMDRKGRLWAATWGSLCYLDPATGNFTAFPELSANRTYHAILEDREGVIWAGSGLGLQRIDPATGGVTAFVHSEDPHSVSDNRINSIYQARDGGLWIGTQNGLDKFDPASREFIHYNESDGIAGNVVSCILEDDRQRLWLSTNAGISSFEPSSRHVNTYTVADGLPGPDLTGWGACYKSAAGEMFFGGFSGAVAFFPDRVTSGSYVPPIVLTDFRLFGLPVEIGKGSPLRESIARSPAITLSSAQNIFSLEFSALSYVDPAANRYRYRLDPLQKQWAEVSSEQRRASYTTLPPGDYMFHVQGAASRGPWGESGAGLRIRVLPPWWAAWWFRTAAALSAAGLLFSLYVFRIRRLSQREQILRKSQKDLSLIINTIPAMAWSADSQGLAEFCNRHYLEYIGLSLEQAVGWGWSKTVHPDDLPALTEYWQGLITSGQPGEAEARMRRFDGAYRWFLFRANPLRDESGRIIKWYGTNADIQARKEAQEELQRSEQKHRVVVEAANDAVISMDEKGRILLANPATKRVFDYEPEELIGKQVTVLMPGAAHLQECSSELHQDWRGAEVSARRKDGTEFPAEISFGEMTSNGHKVFTGFIRDITEKKRAVEALKESERDLTLMIETMPGLAWCAAPNGELNYLNKRLLDYTGATLSDWAKGGWARFLHPIDVEPVVTAWWGALSMGKMEELHCRLRRFDGVYRWFQIFGQAAVDDQGVVIRWYGLLLDIDDRKNIEEALRNTQTRLTRATQTATVGEFAAAIAHEINQPLAAVVANGHACLRWLSAEPPVLPKANEAAQRIVRDGKEAGEVVRRIRALFRRAKVETVEVDINDVIGQVIRLVASETGRRGVLVQTELASSLSAVVVDAVQLQQVVFNLLMNAIEAMDSVAKGPRKLAIRSAQPSPESVLVEVEDSGPGLTDTEKVFEAFFTTKESGMGMGLAICRSIISAHHGRLWATSLEAGTKFSFTLPTGSKADHEVR